MLAALAVAHMIALHFHGSNNPNGLTSNGDRYAMYPYFIFKVRRLNFFTHPKLKIKIEQGKSCVNGFRTTYLGTQGNLVLNRACMKKVLKDMKQLMSIKLVQLDMVRAKLPKFQFSFHSHKCVYLSCKEIYLSIFIAIFKGFKFTHRLKSCTNSIIKGIKRKPKSKCSRNQINSGQAKVSDNYAARGLGVTVFRYVVLNSTRSTLTMSLRRSPLLFLSKFYSTKTGSYIYVLSRLKDLIKRSNEYPDLIIDRDLYKPFILNKHMYQMAYPVVKENFPALNKNKKFISLENTTVILPKDFYVEKIIKAPFYGLSYYFINNFISELKSEAYTFSLNKSNLINYLFLLLRSKNKKNIKVHQHKNSARMQSSSLLKIIRRQDGIIKKKLTIPALREDLIQVLILRLLNIIFLPTFLNTSFS